MWHSLATLNQGSERYSPMRLFSFSMKLTWLLVLGAALSLHGQVNTGELRLRVTDPAGSGLKASIAVSNEANDYSSAFISSSDGEVDVKELRYGIYVVRAEKEGFAPFSENVDIRSAIPLSQSIRLFVAPVTTSIEVKADTLIDPYVPSSVVDIGPHQIEGRVQSLPGRSVQDLVNSEPGWLYEGNAVLHPRGSEYQTQFVVDGIPLTDNRSPGFGPEIEADDLDSISIYTSGFPAEYGRKMGGVIELNSRRRSDGGLHGQVVLSRGSYDSGSSYARLEDAWGKTTLGFSGSGSMSAHYLNPVVPENYSNRGTTGNFSTSLARDMSESDRLSVSLRHEISRYQIPNELVQEQAGQLQTGGNFETIGTVSYQHIFSPESVGALVGFVRDNANELASNQASTPIVAFSHDQFREGYFKATYSQHRGSQEYKAGVESDTTFLHESFHYVIADATRFDADTPASLAFVASRPDVEESAFGEDLIRHRNWTVSAGVRWDHYQLLLNQGAFSPRLSVGRYFPSVDMVVHASFDRIFQTPSFKNILISGSTQIDALSSDFLRLPVQPSRGNYYEGGLMQALSDRMSVAVNLYRRDVRNFADDDQLLNTQLSYPIAFDKSVIYGAEGKLSLVRLGRLTGFASYSYMVGVVWYPVTGGLFLGDDASAARTQLNGHFPTSQDQRNTLRTRLQYRVVPRLWFASGVNYGSGLPFAYTGNEADALAQYGTEVISRIDFSRGRILPSLAVNASVGAEVYRRDGLSVHFQADGDNLNDRLNVIDFGGLFSGNAIAPGRTFGLRLSGSF